MKRLRHYKFISSIRSRALPARRSCSGLQSRSRRPFVSPPGRLAGPTPSARTSSSVAPGSWAGSSGAVFMWPSKAPSGIPGQLRRIHFHPWPQTMPCTRPQRRKATMAWAELSSPTSEITRPDTCSTAEWDSGNRCSVAGNSPTVLTIHANNFTNKWVSYTFIATPRHSYSF